MEVGSSRTILYALGFIGIVVLLFSNPFFSIYISSIVSGEPSIFIVFPDPVEVFNGSFDNYTYYAEVWVVVSEGLWGLLGLGLAWDSDAEANSEGSWWCSR